LISPEQYAAFSQDPAFLAGLGKVLAAGGVVTLDSPGQQQINELLAASRERLAAVLAGPVDLGTGPSAEQALALYALAGTSDRALQELTTHWLFARYPELELRYDAGSDTFYWWHQGGRQSSPFLDSLIANLKPLDIESKLLSAMGDRDGGGGDEFCRSEECGMERTGSEDHEFTGVFSVRPKFEAINSDRTADLRVGDDFRLSILGPAIGLALDGDGSFVVPGGERFGFDINDNRVEKRDGDNTDGQDLLIRDWLGRIDPGLLAGSDTIAVNARGEVVPGGLGDDFLLQFGGDVTYDPGGGVNTAVIRDGSTTTVVDGHGDTAVVTVPAVGSAGSGEGVNLKVVDNELAYQGDLSVLMGTNGSLTVDLDEAGVRNFVIGEGVTIDASGGIRSTDDGGVETITNSGALTGDGGPLSVVDLGPGSDSLTTSSGSTISDLLVNFGDGDDTGDLAGAVNGTEISLGEDNDLLLVRDTVTGDVVVVDPKSSWMWAGGDDVKENDQLLLVGNGFDQVDPDDPGAGIQRLAADGTPVASIGFDGDPERVELIAVVGEDGAIKQQFQAVDPDVREKGGFLSTLSDLAKIAGIATGQVWLTAAGVALNGAHTAVNGGDLFDVAVSTGTGLVGAVTGLDWVVPAGTTLTSALNGEWDTAVLNGLTAVGGLGDIPDLTNAAQATTGVLNSVNAFANNDPLGAVRGLVQAADAATGTTDQNTYDRILTTTGVINALATLDPDDPTSYTTLALAVTQAANTYNAFTPPPPGTIDPSTLDNTTPTGLNWNQIIDPDTGDPLSSSPTFETNHPGTIIASADYSGLGTLIAQAPGGQRQQALDLARNELRAQVKAARGTQYVEGKTREGFVDIFGLYDAGKYDTGVMTLGSKDQNLRAYLNVLDTDVAIVGKSDFTFRLEVIRNSQGKREVSGVDVVTNTFEPGLTQTAPDAFVNVKDPISRVPNIKGNYIYGEISLPLEVGVKAVGTSLTNDKLATLRYAIHRTTGALYWEAVDAYATPKITDDLICRFTPLC
jgi:hypothetical protein